MHPHRLLRRATAALTLTVSTAFAGVHIGNPTNEVHVVPGSGWTLTVAHAHAGTLHVKTCSTGAWVEADQAQTEQGAALGWVVPEGTWCAGKWHWDDTLDIDAAGPDGRSVDATVDMDDLEIPFDDDLVIAANSTRLFVLGLGDGGIWTAAEAWLDPNEHVSISPPSQAHDTLAAALGEARLVEDLNADGSISATEVANATIGTTP